MVLLTSSAISVAISSGVVCIFTFLLFLSGYVLQQQTVKSLQYALKNPPPKPYFPTPTLPPQFQDQNETIILAAGTDEDSVIRTSGGQQAILGADGAQAILNIPIQQSSEEEIPTEPTPRQLWHDYVNSWTKDGTMDDYDYSVAEQDPVQPRTSELILTQDKLAYIFTLPHTSDLCSAALFTKLHRETSNLLTGPGIVFLYPATWEMSDSSIHIAALDLLREMEDKYNVICHPVSISRIWVGVDTHSQLLSELQRTRWQFDRAIYLRSPGMALDISTLDRSLALSDMKKSWQPMNSKNTSKNPALLFYGIEKGLLAPRADMTKLVAEAITPTVPGNRRTGQLSSEAEEARQAAYVSFDGEELDHRGSETMPYDRLLSRFERDRQEICAGTGLLETGE